MKTRRDHDHGIPQGDFELERTSVDSTSVAAACKRFFERRGIQQRSYCNTQLNRRRAAQSREAGK